MARPTKYDNDYPERLIKHMAGGLSYNSFAGVIGVCRDSLYEWERHYPQWLEAKKLGFDKCLLFWESVGRSMALGRELPGGDISKANVSSWIFQMKNRFGWRDRQEMEVSGKDGGPIQINETRKFIGVILKDRESLEAAKLLAERVAELKSGEQEDDSR